METFPLSLTSCINNEAMWVWCTGQTLFCPEKSLSSKWFRCLAVAGQICCRAGSNTFHPHYMSWSASWYTLPYDGCVCKFKLHVFYELHTVAPAFLYSILLLAMKQAYWVLYGYKTPHKANYTKGFYVSWDFFTYHYHCHTPVHYFLSFFLSVVLRGVHQTLFRYPIFFSVSFLLTFMISVPAGHSF